MFKCKRFIIFGKKMNKNRRVVFLKLLFSYMALLLLSIFIGVLFFNKIESIMVHNANRSNTAMLEQVRRVVDNRFNEIERFSMEISFNPKLQRLLNDENSSNYKYIEFVNELARYQIPSSLINDYYLYFSESDVILTPSMKTGPYLYYTYIEPHNNMPYDELIKTKISGHHFKHYYPSEKVITDSSEKNIITFIQSLPFGERTDIKGSLVIRIDEQQINDMLQEIEGVNKGLFYIVDENKEIIMSTDKKANIFAERKRIFENKEGFLADKLNGQEMITSYTTSEQNNWTYVSIVPKNIVLSQVNQVKSWAVILIIGFFIIGVITAYYLANRNYRPIQEVVNAILQGNSRSKGSFSNELDLIKQTIVSSMDEQAQLNRIVSQQAPVIKADFISRMIRGHVEISTVTEKDLEFMGVRFSGDYFSVLIIKIDDCSQFVQKNTETDWALARFIISNLSEELLLGKGYTIELERDQLVILKNHNDASEENGKRVTIFINQLKGILEQHFKMETTVAISQIHHGIQEISECFGEAVIALDYQMVKGPNSVIFYKEIKDIEGNEYHYPLETEVQLFNYAKIGDFANVKKTLDHIFTLNIQSKNMTPEIGKCLSFNLLSTWIKLLNQLSEKDKKRYLDEENPFKLISDCRTMIEIQESITRLYQEFCHNVKDYQTDHSERLYKKMIAYMEGNYHDNMFSLKTMADHFGMNPSYLSAFFKKQAGQNITDFITQLRVNESKRMLVDQQLTISEIAQRVGYANSVGLIRVFKKIEGIPPGQYRATL